MEVTKIAVINPPGFLQNAGATHTAEQFRDWHGLLLHPPQSASSLIPRGGVNIGTGFSLVVTQTGSPSMAVIVRSGVAAVPGSEGSRQGVYSVMNDADVTLSISAAHATLNRIDRVCFKIEDQAYSGALNTSSLVVVTGTPASSPAAPTAPNNSLTLATVFIGAAVSSIVNANITDVRIFMAAAGGLVNVASQAERDTLISYDGLPVYRRDKDRLEIFDGTVYRSYMPTWRDESILGSSVPSVTFSPPAQLKALRISWAARSDVAVQSDYIYLRVNGDTSAIYNDSWLQVLNTTLAGASTHNATRANCGICTGASASGGWLGGGFITVHNWDNTGVTLSYTFSAQAIGTSVASHIATHGGGNYGTGGSRTSITLMPASGNFVATSQFTLEGVYAIF